MRTKRIFDILLIIIAAPLIAPILLVLVVLVSIFLGMPVFFVQDRPGFGCKLFRIYKFRTMTDARDQEGRLLPDAERITAFGRFLRSTSLDELPELFNVLKGEMSLVGPRPLLEKYLPRYTAQQMRRHEVLPGITGWAQVKGRNAISWEEKFKLDVWYVDNQSAWLDIRIIILTFIAVTKRKDINQTDKITMEEFIGKKENDIKDIC